jgi:type II secretory pathway predicted ATPase ExeA
MAQNPFTPVFGNEPPILAGRELLMRNVLQGLENAPGDPYRVVIFTGPRGSGKTVLLSKIANEAEACGWIAIHTVAADGMLADLTDQFERKGTELLPKAAKQKLTGVQAAGFGVSIENVPEQELGWRTRFDYYLDELEKQGVGLLFTVDEVTADVPEMATFVSTIQLFIREKRNIALLMAGLPNEVMQLYQHKSITFLRRAFLRKLDPVSRPEVRAAMKKTVELVGRKFETAALETAAVATQGYPFMIQLIGYHVFNQSDRKTITMSDVEEGIKGAKEDMENMILIPSLKNLTKTDKKYLIAMLPDDEESSIADIAERLQVSASTASHYKRRLIDHGILYDAGRGLVAFNMPMMKTLLSEWKE